MDAILDSILNLCFEILKQLILIYIVIPFLRISKVKKFKYEIETRTIEFFIIVQIIGNDLSILCWRDT